MSLVPVSSDIVLIAGYARRSIGRVAEEARMPVLKHYQGNCHVYVDRAAELAMAERILINANPLYAHAPPLAEQVSALLELALGGKPRVICDLAGQERVVFVQIA